jgi:hypothetical protein
MDGRAVRAARAPDPPPGERRPDQLEQGEPDRPAQGWGRLVVVAVVAGALAVAAISTLARDSGPAPVADGDLVLTVHQAQVVDVLAPAMTSARVDATVQNTSAESVTITAASIAGYLQTVEMTIPAGASADVALRLQVSCGYQQPAPSTATTLTIEGDDGTTSQVRARVVAPGAADRLLTQCHQRVYGG